jgi:hypothetical protein
MPDTTRTDFYLDGRGALDYRLIDAVVAGELERTKPMPADTQDTAATMESVAAKERSGIFISSVRPATPRAGARRCP